MDAELRKAIINYQEYGISPTGYQLPRLEELARIWGYDTSRIWTCSSCIHAMLCFMADYLHDLERKGTN